MNVEETDKDLIISFALDIGDGYIKSKDATHFIKRFVR